MIVYFGGLCFCVWVVAVLIRFGLAGFGGGGGGGFGVAPAIEEKVRVALNLSQRGKVFILGLFTYCD